MFAATAARAFAAPACIEKRLMQSITVQCFVQSAIKCAILTIITPSTCQPTQKRVATKKEVMRPFQAVSCCQSIAMHGERERSALEILKAQYVPVKDLKRKHRLLIKKIKSLEQGRDGSFVSCVFCHYVGPIEKMQINHINGNKHDNRLENLEPCDQECNNNDHGRRAAAQRLSYTKSVSERSEAPKTDTKANEITQTNEAQVWTSKEGLKHDMQRYAWNKWIFDIEKGPFAGRNKKLYPSALAKLAPWKIGYMLKLDGPFGSSITYRRFIEEDKAGGIFYIDVDEAGKELIYLAAKPKTTEK